MSQLFNTGIIVARGNSTTTPLAANATFTGTTDDVTSYEEIDINVAGSPNNAPGSLYFEFSPDGTHWDVSILVGGTQYYSPNIVPQFLRVVLPFFRVRYVNGNMPQTELRLTVVYHRVSGMRLTRYPNQTIDDTEGVQIERSIMAARTTNGTFVNLMSNDNTHLFVDGYITDGSSTVGISDVLGEKALKVDVIKTVSSGTPGSGGTSSNFDDPFPTAGTAAGYFDGYYMRDAMVYDLDLSASSEYVIGTNLRTFGASGSVEVGTNTNPFRIDPTGTTIQPISGTITSNQGTSPWIVRDNAADGYLQNIALNQTNGAQHTIIDGYVQTNPNVNIVNIPTVNQGTSPWITDVTDRSGRLLGHVSVDGYVQTNPSVNVNNFPAQQHVIVDGYVQTNPVVQQGTNPWVTDVTDRAARLVGHVSVDGYVQTSPNINIINIPTVNQGTNPWETQNIRSTTAIDTSVAASVTNVVLLSSNSNRLGATFWNESSSATLYLKLGTTASITSYTVQVLPSGYYEIPFGYTGEIDGIWSAAIGSARVSELA